MKTMLLALVAIVALTFPALAGGYVTAYGGANFGEEFSVGDWITFDKETGSVMGVAVGTRIAPDFRGELDLSFRQNDIGAECFDGTDNTTGFLANVIYDVPVGTFPIRPYVLAGVGFGHRTIEVRTNWGSSYSATEDGLAWQAGFGAQYAIDDGVRVGVGYRYFDAPNVERTFGKTVVNADGSNNSVIATLSVDL